MAVARKRTYSPEEYLALEAHSEIRHEFVNGEIFDMAGGTAAHNRITLNLVVALQNDFGRTKKPCEVYATDMRLRIRRANAITYPDIMVVCGKIDYDPGRQDLLTNPIVIFEVLSDSTAAYDHSQKFALYRKLPTLQEYVLVDQQRAFVERFRKTESGLWVYEGYESIADTLPLSAVDTEIPLTEIYRGIELETNSHGL